MYLPNTNSSVCVDEIPTGFSAEQLYCPASVRRTSLITSVEFTTYASMVASGALVVMLLRVPL